ncbi:hypothetical protein IGI04_029701 [Brassica rapa subsp. trilocularis]|uniref:FBD domain-containing protein n=1 Tax=Brassica rapa subsp. trilocularis TaxID=1813537 RepID=A0ABQ7LQ90_BRACM|nr:hypothetical protein IGI04_029701 [Brassica rapa subsp. trilocularis]
MSCGYRCWKVSLIRSPNSTLPKSLYTCRTLLKLTLSNNIVVDDSHVKLLSSCPVLKKLSVLRDEFDDNVTTFIVKVPSLENLIYECKSRSRHEIISNVFCFFFSKIEEFFTVFLLILYYVSLIYRLHVVEPLHSHGSKVFKLRLQPPTLFFYSDGIILKLIISSLLASQKGCSRNLPISWNQPSSVPVCLLSHLEIFQFKGYRKRREEKLFVAYILANSKCLKTAGISLRSS